MAAAALLPPLSAPLDLSIQLPQSAKESLRKLCLSFPTDRPSAFRVKAADVDAVIRDYKLFRPSLAQPEPRVPAWARVLFIMMLESGRISLGDLCLRAAVQLRTVREQYVPGFEQQWAKRSRRAHLLPYGKITSLKHMLHLSDYSSKEPSKRFCVWLRRDVHDELTWEHFHFAMHYLHMHKHAHPFLTPDGRVVVLSQLPQVPTRAMDDGARQMAMHAMEAERRSPISDFEVKELALQPAPTVGPLNLRVCTLPCCVDETDEDGVPVPPIGTPTEFFNIADFISDEYWCWRPSSPMEAGLDLFF